MKKLLPFLILILTTVVMSQTSQVVLDSAGRKIMIKPDGTWEYVLEKVEKAEINKSIIADDLSTLAPFLEKNKKYLEKSEFETEEEFSKRLQQFLKTTINPSSGKPLDETVIMIPNVAYYDAETQTFAFDGFKYKLDQIDGKTSKTQVSFVERKRYFWSDFHLWTANGPKIKMAPAKAAEIKSDIVVALYGWPVIAEKIFDGYFTISIVPRKYVVLNIKTGQVYLTADEKKLL